MLPPDATSQHGQLQASTSAVSSSSLLSSLGSLSSSSSYASTSYILPDLKPLKKAASFKALDPAKQICQYELPGGGVCRDAGCEDVHLSRVVDGGGDVVEPNGTWILLLTCSCVLILGWLMRFLPIFCCFSFFLVGCAFVLQFLPFESPFPPLPLLPTDEDTAEYIYDNLSAVDASSSWFTQERSTTIGAIQVALGVLRGTGKTYEERVGTALAALQPPATTSHQSVD